MVAVAVVMMTMMMMMMRMMMTTTSPFPTSRMSLFSVCAMQSGFACVNFWLR
jgi:hypothetical protein